MPPTEPDFPNRGHRPSYGLRPVHVVADYGEATDLAFNEVYNALMRAFGPDLNLMPLGVASFDTVSCGFAVAELAFGPFPVPSGGLIYHNVAPRKDDRAARPGNRGERFYIARVPKDDLWIAGPASGYSWSFCKGLDFDVREAIVEKEGTQFRSRDLFPEIVARVLSHRDEWDALARVDLEEIPDVPNNTVAYVDGYGNLKLWADISQFRVGERVGIEFIHADAEPVISGMAVVAGGSFEVPEGALALSVGSSHVGRPVPELFLRGGSAAKYFGLPQDAHGGYMAGAPLSIVPLTD